jgi:acyl carrier protein
MAALDARLRKVFSEVFDVEADTIGADASPVTLNNWDSIHAITLLLSLEEEFGVTFTDDEAVRLARFDSILAALEQKGAR